MQLDRNFYNRSTLKVAEALLGKCLVFIDKKGNKLAGIINETEAYIGENDPACHAARGKTKRNQIMYSQAGFSYVYFIYGMYFCLNIVTERENFPAAVLIRSVIPKKGAEIMLRSRGITSIDKATNGPGKLCQAFGINKSHNGIDLCSSDFFYIEDLGIFPKRVIKSPRVGIRKGFDLKWRFLTKDFK